MIGNWMQKIKQNKRRIGVGALALFLAGVMGVNLLQNSTSTIYAAEPQKVVDPDTTNDWDNYTSPGGVASTQNVGRIWTDKTVTDTNYTFTGSDNLPSIEKGDSDFIVALSALSSTSNLKAMVATSTPLDIVLVLDQSGSMAERFGGRGSGTRREALQEAAENFINATEQSNQGLNQDQQHRMSIVTFDSGSSVSCGWTYVSGNGTNQLRNTVDDLKASGATRVDLGMEDASNQLNSSRQNAMKVVIVFTDGDPTSGSSFENEVAADAINTAHTIKQTQGAKVYTIGIFSGANPNTDNNANNYMNAMSSNYPTATADGNNGWLGWGAYFNITWGDGSRNDGYYKSATNSEELNKVFEEISDEIQKEDPSGSPIEETTSQGNIKPGSLTFTDRLGAYMHVTGIGNGEDKMQIAYADEVFTSRSKTTSGNIDTYHFEGEVAGNAVYGAANLSDLTVTVERSDDLATGDIVTVTIPASLIPMRHYDVDTDDSSMTVTSAYPVRLFYGVSVKEEAKKAMSDSSSDVYNEIAKTNLSDDKKTIDFYSNLYTTGNGNTTADFSPNIGNKFYYYTDDTELYVDKNCAARATARNIGLYNTLYYSDPYWTQGNETATKSNEGNSISINGLDWGAITYDRNGNAYIPGHTQRKDRPNTLNSNKAENKTGTAETILSPEWASNDSVTQHLGNNGKISYPAAGQLEIKKGVDWGNASDETKQNQNNFTFTVELTDENNEELIGEFPYDIYDENSDQPVEVDPQTTIQSGETITLKAGQRAVISNLPSGAKYKVTEEEANENGFTTTDTSSEETNDQTDGIVIGAIVAGSQQSVSFQNDYDADEPVLLSTEGTIQVKKVLEGREWRDDDEFTFSITASNEDAAPLPKENRVTITKKDEQNDFTKAFGDIEFNESGEYRYSINEIQGNIVGIDYSTALYRVIVNVVDGGNGQLKIGSIKLDRMATDDGEDLSTKPETIDPVDKTYTATYTNKYIMDGTGGANIAGTKTYYDHSGQNPIDGSKFLFKLNALGGYKTADGMSGDTYPIEAENVPMPRDEEGNIVSETGNVVNDFTFETIYFDGNDVGNTYVYEVTEIPGSEANMSYDQTVYTVTIEVTEDTSEDPEHTGHAHINTSVSYKKTLNGVTEDTGSISFVNNYDPTEVTLGQDGAASITGTKTLTGRNMTDQDVFNFKLTPYGDATNTAINNGIITGIDSNGLTATVTGPVDKDVAKEFSFENITFKKPGTYRFLMDETDSGISNGITYDESTCVVTVTIGLDKDSGKLVVNSIEYDNNDNNFVNSYNATLNYGEKGGINVTKQMLDRPMKANEFAFSITGTDSTNVSADEATEKLGESDKNFANSAAAQNATITMPKLQNLTFDQNDAGKIFSYIVDELEPGKDPAPGVTYDQSQYQIDIEVIDNGDGTMHTVTTVTKNKDSDAEEVIVDHVNSGVEGYVAPSFGFVNDYNPTPTTIGEDGDYQLTVNKTVTGAPNTDDFAFSATFNEEASTGSIDDIEGLTNGSTTATITEDFNDGDSKSVDFDTLTFKAPGEYVFTVKEDTTTDDAGWTYDNKPQNITIVVTDLNKDYQYDGNLYIESVTNKGLVEITNSYSPDEIIIGGDGANQQIMVQKSVTGSNTESDFTFQLEPIIEEEDKDKWNSVEPVDPNFDGTATINDGVTTDAPKTVSFGGIKFSEEGTFEFKVSEVGASDFNQGTDRKGWTYDEHTSKVTINITDSNFDGYLEASIVYDNSDATTSADKDLTNAAAFTNKYSTTPVKLEKDTDSGIGVQKQVTGAPNTDDFAFSATFNEEASTGSIDDIEGLTNGSTTATITEDFNDGDSKSVDFDTLTFKAPGEYVFTVKEDTTTDDAGWTYDSLTKQIKITVVDNGDGTLVASVDGNDPLFVNKYEPNSVTLEGEDTLKVTKKVIGAPATEEFQFTLALTEGDASSVTGLDENNQITLSTDEMTGENAKTTDTVDFGQLTFSKVGNYVFTVQEDTTTDNAGWTYDNDPKTITVEVTDEGFDGKLDVIVNGNNPTVINKYESKSVTTGTETLGNPQVTKVVEGSMATEEFQFTLALTEGDASGVTGLDENNQITLSTDEMTGENAKTTDTVDFGQLAFSKVGDYVFTVTEDTKATVGGWTYDNDPKTITYHVTDEGFDGQLDATVDGNNPTVTNKYEAADFTGIPTDFTLTKVFEGKEWSTEDVFEFTLIPGENTAGVETPMPANPTVQVKAPTEEDGKTAKFDFGSITYDTVGEYHYTVSEKEGTNAGIDYSKNVAEITVTVTDNKQGGLVASAKVENGIFTNTYSSELDYVGKGGIELVKNLIGYDLTKDNQFTFTLSAADEASKEKAGMQDMSEDVFNTEDTMDANGLSTSTIQLLPKMQKFTQDDVGKVYKYTVSETSEQKPGYTNDTTEYTIQISTSDDGSGTLTVSTRITGTNGTDITYEYTQSKQKAETGVAQVVFNNTYTSSTNTEGYDASVNLTGTKTLTNRPMVDGEFQFNVLSNGSVVSSGTNTADGIVTFTPINYTNDQLIQDHANGIASKEGNTYTYVYDVEEVTPGNGVSIVAGEFSVTVKVTDNGDGKLVTKVIYPEGGLAFENAYGQSANAELNIHGTKKLAENGTNHPDITGKFQFTITGSDGAPMPEQTTVRNDAAGNINFGKIVYTMQNVFGDDGQQTILEEEPVVDQEMPIAEEQTTEDGTVSEDVVGLTEQVETYSEKREKTFTYTITESGSLPGVTNDSAKVINVKVIDNGDGTISVTSDTQGTFTFVNTYVPDPTDETSPTDSAVTIKKVLDGRTLKADEFSFTMMDENGNGVQATNAEDGSVVFPKLTFDKEGIYTYTISETNDNKGGVNYDTTTYKAIATVTDDTSGKLKVEWKVTDAQGKEINEITFNNKYTVQPTSLTLGATKVLEGRELADKEFLFVLSDEEGNVVEEAYNDKTGKVTFSDLTFDKAGTYNYTVTEKNTNAKGITYDESVYNIQVEVVDNEDGTLNMTTTTTKDGEVSSIVFRNKAEKDSVPEQPEKGDTSNTSTRTFAGLFTSLAVDAAALAGIATLLKKRNAKK